MIPEPLTSQPFCTFAKSGYVAASKYKKLPVVIASLVAVYFTLSTPPRVLPSTLSVTGTVHPLITPLHPLVLITLYVPPSTAATDTYNPSPVPVGLAVESEAFILTP